LKAGRTGAEVQATRPSAMAAQRRVFSFGIMGAGTRALLLQVWPAA
jgi:hypothetical protein